MNCIYNTNIICSFPYPNPYYPGIPRVVFLVTQWNLYANLEAQESYMKNNKYMNDKCYNNTTNINDKILATL